MSVSLENEYAGAAALPSGAKNTPLESVRLPPTAREVNVPTEVRLEAVTPEFNVFPVTVPAAAVTGAKIADDSINSEHYVDGSIDTAHIADDQVTEAKMADDAIGSAQLKSLSTLLIKNSSGTTLKTVHGAGA